MSQHYSLITLKLAEWTLECSGPYTTNDEMDAIAIEAERELEAIVADLRDKFPKFTFTFTAE